MQGRDKAHTTGTPDTRQVLIMLALRQFVVDTCHKGVLGSSVGMCRKIPPKRARTWSITSSKEDHRSQSILSTAKSSRNIEFPRTKISLQTLKTFSEPKSASLSDPPIVLQVTTDRWEVHKGSLCRAHSEDPFKCVITWENRRKSLHNSMLLSLENAQTMARAKDGRTTRKTLSISFKA